MPSAVEVRDWHRRSVLSSDGANVGELEDVYVDRDTGEPAFLLVHSGRLGRTLHLVPADGATLEGEDVRVDYDSATIEAAPKVPADDDISPEEEQRLFEHYGRPRAGDVGGVLTITRWVLIERRGA